MADQARGIKAQGACHNGTRREGAAPACRVQARCRPLCVGRVDAPMNRRRGPLSLKEGRGLRPGVGAAVAPSCSAAARGRPAAAVAAGALRSPGLPAAGRQDQSTLGCGCVYGGMGLGGACRHSPWAPTPHTEWVALQAGARRVRRLGWGSSWRLRLCRRRRARRGRAPPGHGGAGPRTPPRAGLWAHMRKGQRPPRPRGADAAGLAGRQLARPGKRRAGGLWPTGAGCNRN
jgi:hypothetical protein